MKTRLFTIFTLILLSFNIMKAQDTKETSMQYKGGTLKFAYYDKDGIKVPHGIMEYTSDKYTETGELIDGYREGKWTAIRNTGNISVTNTYTFKHGLLDGVTTIEEKKINNKTKKDDLVSTQEYTFRNGHLFGENKIVGSIDTLYCNFDEKGNRIGTWKLISKEHTRIGEYSNSDFTITNAYELDELGQKKDYEAFTFHNLATLNLTSFESFKIKQIPYTIREQRPNLPSLLEVEYGMYSSIKPIP